MIIYNKRNNKFKPIFVHKFLVLGSSLFDIYIYIYIYIYGKKKLTQAFKIKLYFKIYGIRIKNNIMFNFIYSYMSF